METVLDLYHRFREQFPAISSSADRFHEKRWGDTLDVGVEYAWFEALADALNEEMRKEVPQEAHHATFQFLERVYGSASDPVQKCIDVSFAENLFWQVPSAKCRQYWDRLPPKLKQLYTDFHRRDP